MSRPKKRIRLGTLLVIYTAAALLLAVGVFFGSRNAAGLVIDRFVYTRESILSREKQLAREFEDYLNDNGLTLEDRPQIRKWFEGRDDLIISTLNGGASGDRGVSSVELYTSVSDPASTYELLQSQYSGYWYFGMLNIRAGREDFHTRPERFMKSVEVMYFPMYRVHRMADYGCIGLSFIAFAAGLILMVRKKTRYVAELSRQLAVMESGELGIGLDIRGRDELTSLAENMESMRLSFIERLRREEDMSLSQRQLMTDMSHDLRTPLTALIGYLDIVQQGKLTDEAQKQRCLDAARRRAYQIKEMTDELFEYFLVYSDVETLQETELLDSGMVLGQIWEECVFSLENEGFICESRVEAGCPIRVNRKLLRRVADNMAGNIRKYADASVPVRARLYCRGEAGVFEVTNAVSSGPARGESSGIGLSSCRKIARLHAGTFEAGLEDGLWVCRLILPGAINNNLPSGA